MVISVQPIEYIQRANFVYKRWLMNGKPAISVFLFDLILNSYFIPNVNYNYINNSEVFLNKYFP